MEIGDLGLNEEKNAFRFTLSFLLDLWKEELTPVKEAERRRASIFAQYSFCFFLLFLSLNNNGGGVWLLLNHLTNTMCSF